MQIGQAIRYVDEYGKCHAALITQVWGEPNTPSAINVVYVAGDESKSDQYGRQILRATSVVHNEKQSAPGRYYYYFD